MFAITRKVTQALFVVTALGFASGCSALASSQALSAGSLEATPVAPHTARDRAAERIQMRMNRHAERGLPTYR